jgi:hypothetical protein
VNPTLEDVSVGIILEVTPRTSPDGTIVMRVTATKSSVGPEATGIPVFIQANADGTSTVVRSPQIPLTTADTTVSARSGQTVILGGLITKTLSETTRRIPYLADIPMLGRLFRFDSVSDQRTELLIIMTPHILQSEEQSEWFNARESERMSWCIADIVNIHGPVNVSGNPAFNMPPSDVIFPDLTPTGPQPTPATPPMTLPGPPSTPAPPRPGLPVDPLLPPGPPGGYGTSLPTPVQIAPLPAGPVVSGPAEAIGSSRRGALGGEPPRNDLRSPAAIQPVAPPPGTQAQFAPQGPPQFQYPPQIPPPSWGQGYAPPGPVSPAMYQPALMPLPVPTQ